MPRARRMCQPGVLQHVLQKGNNRQTVFLDTEDYQQFLRILRETAQQFDVKIHAYVLLPGHFHIMLTPNTAYGLSLSMQALGRRYVSYFNHKYERTGTLWEGRFKSTMVQAQRHLLNCCQWLDAHPVRYGLADSVEEYRWSSYHSLGLGEDDVLLTPHPVYQALGDAPGNRQARYRERARLPLNDTFGGDLLACTSSAVPFGDDFFKKSIAKQLGVEFGYTRRGRPRKQQSVYA